MSVSVVDLFCGVGGITHGFKQGGFNVVAGVDVDSNCKYPYEANNDGAKFHQMDLLTADASEIEALYPKNDTKILVGCAPCQPYSSNSRAKRRNDDKWKLVPRFAEFVADIHPEIVSMENVPDLVNSRKGTIFQDFVHRLEELNYTVWHDIVYAPDYGIPQKRKRLVLLASKFGDIKLIDGTFDKKNYPTVWDKIRKLPKIKAGETDEHDKLHRSRGLSELNLRRIQASRPGGTWEDWEDELVAACHRKASGATYKSVYARMRWDEPSPTITTQACNYGSGRFGHPEQDRALSLREMAILQTFPPDYQFVAPDEPVYLTRVGTLIGNAVPVVLGEVIAKSIKGHLNSYGITI